MIPARYDLQLTPGLIFGPYVLNALDENDDPVDITGWVPFAEVRVRPGASKVILDLNPSITDGPNGEITIPKITDEQTYDLKFVVARWSLILENTSGDRLGPFIQGKFIIKGTPTKPPEV
jgi:hypothetical protein